MGVAVGMISLGVVAGILSGAFGIGGAVIIIPALVYFMGMDQKLAQGTTLLLMLPPIGLLAALEYLRRGEANVGAALWIAGGFLLGGYVGARLIADVPPLLLRRGVGLLIMVLGMKMLLRP